MKYLPAFLLLVFTSVNSMAQSANYIKGKIINEQTGAAIASASVFITNTSKGTVSNSTGEFELLNAPVGSYDLVVSCIGYETLVYSYKASQLPLQMQIQMKPKAEELQTVVIEPYDKNGWQDWGKFFTENFIGTSENAKDCTIKNYAALHFRFSKKTNQLTVVADEPLMIQNKSLGYKINYQLEGFSYSFNESTLLYFGYTLFSELNEKGAKERQLKKREKAYNGSIQHFMSSLYNSRLAEEGFEVRRLIKTPNLEKQRVKQLFKENHNAGANSKDSAAYYDRVFRQPDMLEKYGQSLLTADSVIVKADAVTKQLFFTDYLYITYKKGKEDAEYLEYTHERRPVFYPRSVAYLLNNKPVFIDPLGNYFMPQDFMSYGYWSWSEKISTMLPLDYKQAK